MVIVTNRKPKCRGRQYSFLEVLAVLLVVGILTAVVFGRGLAKGPSVAAEAAKLRANLRYVQAQAMADTAGTWSVVFGTDSYSLHRDGSLATVNWPGEDSPTHDLDGVSVSASPGSVVYNALGSPGDMDLTVILSDGDGNSATVTITGGTGFVR